MDAGAAREERGELCSKCRLAYRLTGNQGQIFSPHLVSLTQVENRLADPVHGEGLRLLGHFRRPGVGFLKDRRSRRVGGQEEGRGRASAEAGVSPATSRNWAASRLHFPALRSCQMFLPCLRLRARTIARTWLGPKGLQAVDWAFWE